MIKKILTSLVVIIAVPTLIFADENSLEQAMTDRAQRVLDGVFGKGYLIPVVNVQVSAPSYAVKYTRQSQAAVTAQKSGGGDKVQILPGYPVIKNLAPDNFKQLPFDSVTNYNKSMVQRVNIMVVVSQDFPKNQMGKVQALLEKTMGLNPNRDKIEFNVQKFMVGPPDKGMIATLAGGKSSGSTAGLVMNILLGLIVVILGIFVAVYVWMQLKQQQFTAAMMAKQGGKGGSSSGGEGASITMSPMMSTPKADRGSGGGMGGNVSLSDTKMKHYFDFVTDASIDKLKFIMQREKMGVENLAVLVPCLPAHLAAEVLKELDLNTQIMVVMNSLEPKMFNKALIEKFETQLKSAMECLIGGKSTVKNLLGDMTDMERKQILNALQQGSPDGYQRIRPLVVIFDDLAVLEEQEVKFLLGVVPRDVMFTALIGLESTMRDRFVSNMSFGIRSMFKEFSELRTANLLPVAIESAREQILAIALQLEDEGKLLLRGRV